MVYCFRKSHNGVFLSHVHSIDEKMPALTRHSINTGESFPCSF